MTLYSVRSAADRPAMAKEGKEEEAEEEGERMKNRSRMHVATRHYQRWGRNPRVAMVKGKGGEGVCSGGE